MREIAFLPITESICGLDVVPMTLRHLIALRLIKSPFLTGYEPTEEDCFVFLWHLSKDYSPRNIKAKRKLLKRCRKLFFLNKPPLIHFQWLMRPWQRRTVKNFDRLETVTKEIRNFVSEALQDRPPRPADASAGKSYFSDAASICHRCARKYSWTISETLSIPLKILFQIYKLLQAEIAEERKKPSIMFNPSDAELNKLLESAN